MHVRILDITLSNRDFTYSFSILLLISSIVIADPKTQLDLPNEFQHLSADEVFERGNKQKTIEEENEWRENKEKSKQLNVRWGAKSIYEGEKKEFDPFFSSSKENKKINEVPEATRQIQIKFD